MGDSRKLDRRAFLELAATSTVIATAGVTVAGCQGPPAPPPPPSAPGEVTAGPTGPGAMWVSPLRAAIVPDDVPPAATFHPLAVKRS